MFYAIQVSSTYKALDFRGKTQYRRTFKDGAGLRIFERTKQIVRDQENKTTSAGTALVFKGYFNQLQAENQEKSNELYGKLRPAGVKYKKGLGTLDGYATGNSVQMQREVR